MKNRSRSSNRRKHKRNQRKIQKEQLLLNNWEMQKNFWMRQNSKNNRKRLASLYENNPENFWQEIQCLWWNCSRFFSFWAGKIPPASLSERVFCAWDITVREAMIDFFVEVLNGRFYMASRNIKRVYEECLDKQDLRETIKDELEEEIRSCFVGLLKGCKGQLNWDRLDSLREQTERGKNDKLLTRPPKTVPAIIREYPIKEVGF